MKRKFIAIFFRASLERKYKLFHKDDLDKLYSLDKTDIEKNEECIDSMYKNIIRKLSYFFEMPINCIH